MFYTDEAIRNFSMAKEKVMPNIQHQIESQKFVLLADDEIVGELDYRKLGNALDITHTRIEPKYRGKGLARYLVNAAIQEAEKNGLDLTASCDYAEQILAGEGRLPH
ncbi:GNAT family N-acetyltransferase [Neisseria yangbaofengii]|uniref:GNAT family N-acetyltransferase n=2 Tax=Neisseria yangbaofengii TaxID=2709396 RepID=UPI0021072047|nr:GNAT family N-acetyltransferase [Neisseria yangbaofengii]